jgi:hypothetical protein
MRNPHRREILGRGLKLLTAVAALPLAVSRASAAAASCTQPDSQPLRESLHYTDVAQEAAKACAGCGFFTAEAGKPDGEQKPACGNCMIFSGPVNTTGHCDSWSAKS